VRDKPSSTALLVARGMSLVAADPRYAGLIPPAATALTRQFLRSSGISPASADMSSGLHRSLFGFVQRLTVPGLPLHFALRKRCIEDLVRDSLARGIEQVVVVGAGLDTLALRLCREHPSVRFLEIDHPATQHIKRKAVKEMAPDAILDFISADLSHESFSDVIARWPRYGLHRPTLFVAEAIFMYLTQSEVESFFTSLGEGVTAPRIIFTFMEPRADGSANFQNATWLADLFLRFTGEPARFGISPHSLQGFLEVQGFLLEDLISDARYQSRYMPSKANPLLPRGEHIAVAERMSSRA